MNKWLIIRLALTGLAFAEGAAYGNDWSPDHAVTPLMLAGMLAYGVLVIPLVAALQRLNPRARPVWHFPSWRRNPLTLRDPLQFFLMAGVLFTAAGGGVIARDLWTGLAVRAAQLVMPAFGSGILGGVYLAAWLFRGKLEARAPLVTVLALGLMSATAARAQEPAANPFSAAPPARLPYDREYPGLHYERAPAENAVARLQQRLERGTVRLGFTPDHGYLQSLLAALGIDAGSQVLVYSRTSLQKGNISAATPRAIYFNDDTYVAWVQGSEVMELGAVDDALGQVFYTLDNRQGGAHFQRQVLTCLSCHDTYELSGGGVPRFLLMSSYVDVNGEQLTHEDSILVDDQTPLKYRWGGWYVSGSTGSQVHVGNILVHSAQQLVHLDEVRRGNLDTLDGLFDTRPYLTARSDVVALMVLQHQVTVQNLLTRVNFEVRAALSRAGVRAADLGHARPKLASAARAALVPFMDDLVKGLLFVDAADITAAIRGGSGFDAWFQQQGPRDPQGRSLRELDLSTRLFKYPLSYLICSSSFRALPDYARDYVYGRIAAVLGGADPALQPALTADQRHDIAAILIATDPGYAAYLAGHPPR